MKITDLLKPVSIQLNVAPPKSKTEAIEILADLMEKSGNLNNKEEYLKAVIAREDLLPQCESYCPPTSS